MSIPVSLDRTSPEPLYRQVERQVRAAIETGRLRPGDRVPSVRTLAADLDVGRLTIATAYEQLAADGYLVGRVGFGTVVAPAPPASAEALRSPVPPELVGPVRRPPIEPPRTGPPQPDSAPGARFDLRPGPLAGGGVTVGPALERLLREAWRDLAGGGSTGDPAGDPLLRATIASHVRATRGGRCEPSQVVVLSGALIGMAAVARLWLSGDSRAIAVEDPGDPALRRAIQLDAGRIVTVSVDRHGLRPDLLPANTAVAVALASPTVQAATGASMPLARRIRLLAWAASQGAIVVEDGQADDLALRTPLEPSLQALDEDGRVVYLGGFASILHPGIRVGYAVLPPDLVAPFTATVAGLDPGATPVQQHALGRFLADGHFDRHLSRVRRALTERHEAATDAVRRELGWLVSVEMPPGGSRIVVSIEDDSWTASDVAARALDAGVALERLAAFRLRPSSDRELVIDVGRHEPAELRQAIRLLARAIARQPGTSEQPPPPPLRPEPRRWPLGGRPPVPRLTPALGRGE